MFFIILFAIRECLPACCGATGTTCLTDRARLQWAISRGVREVRLRRCGILGTADKQDGCAS